jgi:3-phosphoshikimate 1-carboxyvinyltransferase
VIRAKRLSVRSSAALGGQVRVPGDKSVSHRALLLGSLAEGASRVSGFLPSNDCLATLACLRSMGVEIAFQGDTTLTVYGRGLRGLQVPTAPLNCVRSGTTMRLLAGILAGQTFTSTLTGEPQLRRRPMRRVVEPLRSMGAEIEDTGGHAPLVVRGRPLRGTDHTLGVASAQVKSALLLAGLCADGPTTVHQPGPARDHTERMLMAMGADVQVADLAVTLNRSPSLSPLSIRVPGDISSAAFLLAAAAIAPGSEIVVEGVGVNPTRTGLLDVLRDMGADVIIDGLREEGNEPVADLIVRTSQLRGVEVSGHTVVRMIDEFPALAVAATQALGVTVVHDAAELRVKETDRIAAIVAGLQALGARIDPLPDGFRVEGPTPLRGAVVDSFGDHRLAMALAVAGLVAEGEVVVERTECIADSFPGFVELIQGLGVRIQAV